MSRHFELPPLHPENIVWTLYVYRWCGPCKLLGPRLEMIIAEEKGKVVMARVDIDENVELAMRYNVRNLRKSVKSVDHDSFQLDLIVFFMEPFPPPPPPLFCGAKFAVHNF